MKFLLLLCFTFACLSNLLAQTNSEQSVARQWNELTLSAIRKDYARPTIAARNLYHMSMIAYDGWAMYDKNVNNFYYTQKHDVLDIELARIQTITVASYRLIIHRFKNAPQAKLIADEALTLTKKLGVDVSNEKIEDNPIGRGNLLAQLIIDFGLSDGALEELNYQTPPLEFNLLNSPLIVKQAGVGDLKNVNFWQPLAMEFIIDQGGNPLPNKIQAPLTLHWARVAAFALEKSDRNPKTNLYLDPGPPPLWNGPGHQLFVDSMVQVIQYSSWLDPQDKVIVDISPNTIGNNSLGKNDGNGHQINPFTKTPYQSQKVYRGDYARVLAEFWADGPNSETPPGHWNVVANKVCDSENFNRRWMGQKQIHSKLEWDVKMYLTLNGALHDTAIAVWGIKGYYQGSRPITAIRYLGSLGQNSHPELPSYNILGLPLIDGLIELINDENTLPGQKFSHLVGHEGQLAIRSWKGAPGATISNRGVGWILATEWVPYQKPTFVTPPFPGYVSGHSGYSRAAAEVLASITGSSFFPGGLGEYKFKANSFLSFESGPSQDVTLQWATYYDAADQSALSRIFGGIHGNIDDFPSRKIGSRIGRRAVAKAQKIFAD